MNERIIELQDAVNVLVSAFSERGQKRIRQEGIRAAKPVYEQLAWVQDSIIPDLHSRLETLCIEAEDAEHDRQVQAHFPELLRDELIEATADFPCEYEKEPTPEQYAEELFEAYYSKDETNISGLVNRWLYVVTGSSENDPPKSCKLVIREVLQNAAHEMFEKRQQIDAVTY